MLRAVITVVLVAGVAGVLAVSVWPEALGWQRSQGVAQAVSFRGGVLVACAAVGVVLVAVALLLAPVRTGAAAIAIVLSAGAFAQGVVLLARGIGAPDVPTAGADDVTVLSWNTLGDSVPAATIARVADVDDATIVSLPETTEAHAADVARLLARDGRTFTLHSLTQQPGVNARSTSLLIASSLGRYRLVTDEGDTDGVPSVVAVPADGQRAPRIVAVHTRAPYGSGLGAWRADLAWTAARCIGDNVIMAGDFNATIDHLAGLGRSGGQVGGCRDAALATGNAAVGTWPTSMPALIGTPIDHVLATPNWRFTGFRVLTGEDSAGSDHRPVLARLTPAG